MKGDGEVFEKKKNVVRKKKKKGWDILGFDISRVRV